MGASHKNLGNYTCLQSTTENTYDVKVLWPLHVYRASWFLMSIVKRSFIANLKSNLSNKRKFVFHIVLTFDLIIY